MFDFMETSRSSTELILNPDGSVYHLKLKEEYIADTVLIVGDQNRVEKVSAHFDSIEHKIDNREFKTHTGRIGNQRITVLSTGIGTDNIDIVLNELDATVNMNLDSKTPKDTFRSLNIIRLGTTGGIQPHLPVDGLLISEAAIGLDGLLNYYDCDLTDFEREAEEYFANHTDGTGILAKAYIREASTKLLEKLSGNANTGFTLTAPGFYAPQCRTIRAELRYPNLFEQYQSFDFKGKRITNFEMETSALYGLGKMLGHNCVTICAMIANRATGSFSLDHGKAEEHLISYVLDKLTT
jgi:uridine phosphorylase